LVHADPEVSASSTFETSLDIKCPMDVKVPLVAAARVAALLNEILSPMECGMEEMSLKSIVISSAM
jgi:hypothetical protein